MGGEGANSPRTIERFLSAAVPLGLDPGALLSGYGLAESTCVVTVPTLGSGVTMDHVARVDVAKGAATSDFPGRPLLVSSPSAHPWRVPRSGSSTRRASPLTIVLSVRSRRVAPCLMLGYLDDPAATRAVMKDGWLMTGDRGYMVDGELYVTGRIKDLIIIKGQNYYAEDVEQVVLTVEAVRPGGCVAFGVSDGSSESLVVAAETKLTENDELIACRNVIKKALWSSTGLSVADVILLPPGTVPKTSSGKLQRGVARASMTRDSLSRSPFSRVSTHDGRRNSCRASEGAFRSQGGRCRRRSDDAGARRPPSDECVGAARAGRTYHRPRDRTLVPRDGDVAEDGAHASAQGPRRPAIPSSISRRPERGTAKAPRRS